MEEERLGLQELLYNLAEENQTEAAQFFPILAYLEDKWREVFIYEVIEGGKACRVLIPGERKIVGLPNLTVKKVELENLLPCYRMEEGSVDFALALNWEKLKKDWGGKIEKAGGDYEAAYPKWKAAYERGVFKEMALSKRELQEGGEIYLKIEEILGEEDRNLWLGTVERGDKWRPVMVLGEPDLGVKVRMDKELLVIFPNDFLRVEKLPGKEIWPLENRVEMAPLIIAGGWLSQMNRAEALYDGMGLTLGQRVGTDLLQGFLASFAEVYQMWKELYDKGVKRPEKQAAYLPPSSWGLEG